MTRPSPGAPAPDFDAVDQNGKRHRLQDYRGRYLILYFYPRDRTRICTAQARAFEAHLKELHSRGAEVLGVSSEDVESHKAFVHECGSSFPLLADPEKEMLHAYGTQAFYGVAKRVTFLIDPEGRIVDSYRNEFNGTAHVQWVLRRLREQSRLATASPV